MSLFSARKVGERVQTLPTDWERASRWSCVETVRYFGERKKESGRSLGFAPSADFAPSAGLGAPAASVKTSPAPSQSEDVMMGGCVWVKPLPEKKLLRMVIASDLRRRRAELRGSLERRWGMDLRNSSVWYLFWSG